jgi:hypothetical protein
MHRQFISAGSGAWLAAGHQSGSGSVLGRIMLVGVAVLAVGAFTVLQIKARSRRRRPPGPAVRRRRYDPSDWRALPPQYWAEGRDDEAPFGNEESYRPDWRYGYPPGYDPPGYDPPGYDPPGYDPPGYDPPGYDPYDPADPGVRPSRAVRDEATRDWGF